MIDPELQGKVLLITGANHGIGAAAARRFAAQGANVFLTYYRPPHALPAQALQAALQSGKGGLELYTARQQTPIEPLLAELRAVGGACAAWEADLGDPQNIPLLFESCEAALGAVDILVNNHTHDELETFDPARVSDGGFPTRLPSAESIDRHFAVNARAYALLMQEYTLRYLRRGAQQGCIINLSTDAAHAHPENVSYAASKHAIESYSRSAAIELGKYGIRVNVVAPGPVQTGYILPEAEAEIAQGTPLGRVGEPEDIADVLVFLASVQARWITGQVLYVGGGWRIGL
jgi:3-oxoacyl-[acyl-carrier protein] reductase